MGRAMTEPLPSDSSDPSSQVWARFKRLMRLMVLLTLAVTGIALWMLYREIGMVSIHFYIATGLGVFFAMLLTAALMGLVFASNASGHDDVAGEDRSGGTSSR